MLHINSMLTIEERTILQSLECDEKSDAINILKDMQMAIPIRSQLFRIVTTLKHKMENEHIDYAYEMGLSDVLEDME